MTKQLSTRAEWHGFCSAKSRLIMAEKTALPQVNYVSDNPEEDWDRFQGTMKRILATSKRILDEKSPTPPTEVANDNNRNDDSTE